MSRKKPSAKDGALRALFQLLRSEPQDRRHTYVTKWRQGASFREQVETYSEAYKTLDLKSAFFGKLLPSTIEDIVRLPAFQPIGLSKELVWQAAAFVVLAKKINKFLNLEDQFTKALFRGEYNNATSLLDQIEADVGFSSWLVESRIATLSLSSNVAKLNEFLARVRDNDNIKWDGRLEYLFHYIKFDLNVSPARHAQIVDEIVRTMRERNMPEEFIKAITFRLSSHILEIPTIETIAYGLWLNATMPLVDRYLNFVKSVINLFANTDHEAGLDQYLAFLLKELCASVTDNRLSAILTSLGGNAKQTGEPTTEIVATLDTYTGGDYSDCLEKCSAYSREVGGFNELIEIEARTLYRLEKIPEPTASHMHEKLVHALANLVGKGEKFESAQTELTKISMQFSAHPWRQFLNAIIYRETRPIRQMASRRLISVELPFLSYGNPRRILGISKKEVQARVADDLEKFTHCGATFRLTRSIASSEEEVVLSLENDTDISPARRWAYVGNWLLDRNRIDEARERFSRLFELSDSLARQAGTLGLILCAAEQQNTVECLRLISDNYLLGEKIYVQSPMEEIFLKVGSTRDGNLFGNLDLGVCYAIRSKLGVKDADAALSDLFEDFLDVQNLKLPSDIKGRADLLGSKKVIFFLREICVPRIMHGTLPFEKADDVLNERIRICQFLSEFDAPRSPVYAEEIKEITQTLIIKQALKEVDESKIFVNKEGILRSIENTLREEFSRYYEERKTRAAAGIPPIAPVLVVNSQDSQEPMLAFVIDKVLSAFELLFLRLRDKFVANHQYGLDTYLSARIRHGILGGHLRRPLQMERLITETGPTGEYLRNVYWQERLFGQDPYKREQILEGLREFSGDVDAIIKEVKDEWLQILTESSGGTGLFNYQISRVELYRFYSDMQSCNTFEEFFERANEILWLITDRSLTAIRARVETELQERLLSKLNQLSQLVTNELGPEGSELNDAIARARTVLQNEIQRVANWFRRPPTSESSSYDLRLPFDIGFAIIGNLYPHVPITKEEIIEENVFLKGYTRQSLVVIVNILLENAVKHSKLDSVVVKIHAGIVDDWLVILCINDISRTVFKNQADIDAYNAKLGPVRKSIEDESDLRLASKEGKSGFQKISRIVLSDLNGTYELSFSARANFTFGVSLKISKGSLIA